MEQMLKHIPMKVVNIPWRNNNLSTLHVDPPLSEQGETFIGIYLLALGRSAIVTDLLKHISVFQIDEGCSERVLIRAIPMMQRSF